MASDHRLLTRRQLQVLQADANGEPHKRIAAQLGISASAVDQHLAAVRARLGADTRAHTLTLAAERGLLHIPPECFPPPPPRGEVASG